MISFIQIPYHRLRSGVPRVEVGPVATAVVLALILSLQIALLVGLFLGK